ncbi:MAG TPA: hypothetical protein VIG68_01920 [Lysobacter sp.]
MLILDRRRCRPPSPRELREQLSTVQRQRLADLEKRGWRLDFVRQGTGRANRAVLLDRTNGRATVEADGTVQLAPQLTLRD